MIAVTYPKAIFVKPRMLLVGVLMIGFGASLGLRIVLGGYSVAQSIPAGLAFASCLLLLTLAAGTRAIINRKVVLIGIAGGLFLCLPAMFIHLLGSSKLHGGKGYLSWAAAATTVAFAEEAFLRGALFDVIKKWRTEKEAVIIAAILFTALHIPLYGWRIVPLDFAVGIWLGVIRSLSGTFVASGMAHAIADLASWWI